MLTDIVSSPFTKRLTAILATLEVQDDSLEVSVSFQRVR